MTNALLLDDRCKPVILADSTTLRASIYNNRPPIPWRRITLLTALVIVVTWFVLSAFSVISTRFPIALLGPSSLLIPAAFWRRGGRTTNAARERVCSATLVRDGRCGGCGFSLRELNAEGDGSVACPECGATWNSDRWRIARADSSTLAIEAVEASLQGKHTIGTLDDRGALLAGPLKWNIEWFDGASGCFDGDGRPLELSKAIAALHANGNARLFRLRWRYASIVLAGIAITIAYFAFVGFAQISAIGYVVTALLALGAFVFAGIAAAISFDARRIALKHSLCPACGELLDLNQPRQFDGCIQCAKCAAAWKIDAKARTPASEHAESVA